MRPHRRQPTRLHRPWDSPGKNTGVGCHCLLQCRKVKSEREVAQLCPTLHDPIDCSPPGSSVHGILQARVLEWDAIAFSAVGCQQHPYLYPWLSSSLELQVHKVSCFLNIWKWRSPSPLRMLHFYHSLLLFSGNGTTVHKNVQARHPGTIQIPSSSVFLIPCVCVCMLSHSVMSDSLQPPGL